MMSNDGDGLGDRLGRARIGFEIAGRRIGLGETRDLALEIARNASGRSISLPFRVRRGPAPGPTVFVVGAVHGDELNGTGIVRSLMLDAPFDLQRGTLVLVPVANIFGFERRSRYLPDRRDLNRSFPGIADGSLASRMAHALFHEIILKCDAGVDLHTASAGRTNYPNIRADMSDPWTARLAAAFGSPLIVTGSGPNGSLRQAAVAAGVPTIVLEAGEVSKVEPSVVDYGVQGVVNVLAELGMVEELPAVPPFRAEIRRAVWVRAAQGGFLRFHVAPGDLVEAGQAIATNADLLGNEHGVLLAPDDGVVLGMTTLPVVLPGEPVCHIAIPEGGIAPIRRALHHPADREVHARLRDDLATNVVVTTRTAFPVPAVS